MPATFCRWGSSRLGSLHVGERQVFANCCFGGGEFEQRRFRLAVEWGVRQFLVWVSDFGLAGLLGNAAHNRCCLAKVGWIWQVCWATQTAWSADLAKSDPGGQNARRMLLRDSSVVVTSVAWSVPGKSRSENASLFWGSGCDLPGSADTTSTNLSLGRSL